jgi:hypothetical protein
MKRYVGCVSIRSILVWRGIVEGLFAPGSAWAAEPMVAAGTFHTWSLRSAGAVRCWGYNGYGELGREQPG